MNELINFVYGNGNGDTRSPFVLHAYHDSGELLSKYYPKKDITLTTKILSNLKTKSIRCVPSAVLIKFKGVYIEIGHWNTPLVMYPQRLHSEVESIWEEFRKENKIKYKSTKNKGIRFIKKQGNSFTLSEYLPVKKSKDIIGPYYNDDFLKWHDKMVEELKHPNKGLYLLHGIPGTGKTSYIKYLAQVIKNRDFIFLPSTYASVLSEPSFLTFLSDSCKDSVLIIEDAEEVLKDRSINQTSAVPNILNITDGMLGDMLNISIISTFNADMNSIDKALLRKGRAKVNYKFEKLSLDKCQKINTQIKEPLSLADALLFEEESLVEERPVIGFGRN